VSEVADPLLHPPIGFAHRGGRAVAADNTIEAFRRAVDDGATGIESDVRLTADGVPVLVHDGTIWSGLRRRSVRDLPRASLPRYVPTLGDLYEAVGTGVDISLDVKDADAAPAVIAEARAAGADAPGRLWLCSPDWRMAASWRGLDDDVHLVASTRLRRMREGPERFAATVAGAGIGVVNLHHTDWNPGLITLFHRFELLTFAWDCQFERLVVKMLAAGCDAIYSDDVRVLMKAIAEYTR
jgi:glycerophosphoryl diester phosphodiesterase